MAAGTVAVLGPYALNDTATMATDLTASGGAVSKTVVAWLDAGQNVYFAVTTQA